MSRVTIEFNRDACIGCGACAAACPENWEMQEDGKSTPKKTELEEAGCNKNAEDACPVKCITVKKAE